MSASHPPDLRRALGRGELASVLYRLGRQGASGVLTLTAGAARSDVLVLRRGAAVCVDGEPAKRSLVARLARAVAEPSISVAFEAGVAACPPGALHQLPLAGWVRSHIEAQLDGALAEGMVRELAGLQLTLRAELAPSALDEADRRMIAALDRPRRLDQIWPLARAPRFRLLAFLHFLRAVGALGIEPAAAERSAPVVSPDARRLAAMRLLGLDDATDVDAVKRAYRRLARSVHPDLQPEVDAARRRTLERRFAELTAAYEALL